MLEIKRKKIFLFVKRFSGYKHEIWFAFLHKSVLFIDTLVNGPDFGALI